MTMIIIKTTIIISIGDRNGLRAFLQQLQSFIPRRMGKMGTGKLGKNRHRRHQNNHHHHYPELLAESFLPLADTPMPTERLYLLTEELLFIYNLCQEFNFVSKGGHPDVFLNMQNFKRGSFLSNMKKLNAKYLFLVVSEHKACSKLIWTFVFQFGGSIAFEIPNRIELLKQSKLVFPNSKRYPSLILV